MQIGEFAKLCGTKISVLRHYDKEGLLPPDYVDRFTGYRYYASEQVPIFFRITALKKAGFSLADIKNILSSVQSNEEVLRLFDEKQAALCSMLAELEDARRILLGYDEEFGVTFIETDEGWVAESSSFHGDYWKKARAEMEKAIIAKDYQRVSSFSHHNVPSSRFSYLRCRVVKLRHDSRTVRDTWTAPFENDESIVGKWEIIGEYAVKEDFYEQIKKKDPYLAEKLKEIYFLPQGERYWCYAWTKGRLLFYSDVGLTVNDYVTEELFGERYMFVDLKSYEYRRGGRMTVLVLRQVDHVSYCASELLRRDQVDLPFVPDQTVLGTWRTYSFVHSPEAFDPDKCDHDAYILSHIRFEENGVVFFGNRMLGEKTESVTPFRYTKGFVIRSITACAYEIRQINGKKYLFLEWKTGDYVYGGFDPDYYVFEKEV